MTATLLDKMRRVADRIFRMHEMNIGPRLALCFVLIILAMSAGSAVLVWQFQEARTQAERLTGVDQELIAVLQAHISFMSFYERLDVLAQTENTTILTQQIEAIHNAFLQETERARSALSRLAPEVQLDPTLQPTLSTIQLELPAQLRAMEMLAKSGDWRAVRLRLANQIGPLESRSAALVESVDRDVAEQRTEAVLNIRKAQERIFLIVPLTAGITLLFAVILGMTITRSITRPLGRLVEGSTAVAKGDFSHRVRVAGNDEIARLGNVFNDMTATLQTDIEEQKRAEEALAASERKLEVIINTIPSLAWSAGTDGHTDFLNERWSEYTALTAEQGQGRGWLATIHPDDRERVDDYTRSTLSDGTTAEVEARIRRYDGEYRWFLFRTNPLLDKDGKIVKWYGTQTDIQDSKRAQEVLAASERDLRAIINTIPTIAWSTRPDGYCDFLNRRWLDYTGMTAEQAQGWGWGGAIHPDDVTALVDYWKACLASGFPVDTETRMRRSDGEYRWFLLRGNPLRDESGKIVKWYGVNIDIEDRKRAEVDLKRAYDSFADAQRLSHTGNFTADVAADEHTWSAELYRIFEFDPGTRIKVQMVREIIQPEDLPSFDAALARSIAGADYDQVFRIVTRSGKLKHVHSIGRLVEHVAGRPLFIGAIQDVTESRTAEEALSRARSELAHVARVTTLNALTASIAHEVNQPLAGIVTNASTCLRMLDSDPPNVDGARETARRTIRDGKRASDVITRLRALFSKKEFTPEPLDLNEATREVLALSLSDLQRNRITLRSELVEALPLVIGDRVQLQQVILNLLRNATDAMASVEDRPRELLIRTEKGEDDARLSVKDVGVGFDPEAGDKLFDAFHTTKKDGMGIGLSVSRSIIEAHRGRLWATPNDGPGVTFSFCIPYGGDTKV
jgi:PAS domain S-box-containing protein